MMCGSLGKYCHGFLLLLASCASEGACASFCPPALGIKKIPNGFQLTLFFGCDFYTVINDSSEYATSYFIAQPQLSILLI